MSTAISADDLAGVFSVPPLPRKRNAKRTLDFDAAECVARHIEAGGITRLLYGGNAFLYHITLDEYEALLGWLAVFPSSRWAIPSLGPSFGRAIDQARLLRRHAFRTAMMLPCSDPRDPSGLEAGIREIADAAGMPLILYLKSEDGFGADRDAGLDAVARLMRDGVAVAIKYAVVRDEPQQDAYLDGLLRRVDRRRVVSGIGERPAVVHMRDFDLPGFTTGSGCIASALCSALFAACRAEGLGARRSHPQPVHPVRGSARRVGAGARAAPRHRARRHRAGRAHSSFRLAPRREPDRAADPGRPRPPRRHRMTRTRLTPSDLRSHRWFGKDDLRSFGHRSRAKQAGFSLDDISGKPVIAILNTWSDANPCHTHFRLRAEEVKRGIWQAGGFPMEIPLLTLGETFMKPTTMMYRNLLAMDAEEALRSYPVDGVVLLAGCDKTVPALVMGATSANLPVILVPAGPMLRGNWRGQILGSGSDVWKYWTERRAGTLDECSWREMEDGMARSFGTCMTMGTASTMTSAVDALGLTLPGASSIPAADSAHPRMATAAGRRIVEMVWEDLRPRDILTTDAFENAVTTAMALGGSTNAIIHLIAMAGRAGAALDLDRFDALVAADAVPRQPPAVRRVPDGGLLSTRAACSP